MHRHTDRHRHPAPRHLRLPLLGGDLPVDPELAKRAIEKANSAKPPDYALTRIRDLELALQMLDDADWKLPPSVRARILTSLSYFANPLDLIPDATPGLGFLDDTIMIELLTREIRHEIAGYRDFIRYREHVPGTGGPRATRIEVRRKRLRARIQERQNREADRTPSAIRRLFHRGSARTLRGGASG